MDLGSKDLDHLPVCPLSSGGFGAEIIATVSRRCFLRLESPPLRVCGMDTPFPLVYEPLYLPSLQRVLAGIKQSVGFGV